MKTLLLCFVLFVASCSCIYAQSDSVLVINTGHEVNSVAYNNSGKILASCGVDTLIKIWDTETGKLIKTLKGNTDVVIQVCFSPDGRFIASGGEDSTIRI